MEEPAPHDDIIGLSYPDKVVNVDQAPSGHAVPNPATYTGLFTPVRELFAEVPTSKERGYQPGRFSFNVKGGRCSLPRRLCAQSRNVNFYPTCTVLCGCVIQTLEPQTPCTAQKAKNTVKTHICRAAILNVKANTFKG